MEEKILGTNRRTYPMQVGDMPGAVDVTVVLVAGAVGDYAAYVGVGEDQWIARFGNKLSFEEASLHFPMGLEEKRYRR